MHTLKLRSGDAGRSRVVLQAKNATAKGAAELPTGLADALRLSQGGATLGIFGSDAACFTAELPDVSARHPILFRAKK